MAKTYKKLSTSTPPVGDVPEGDEWKHIDVEESVTQSPMKSHATYAMIKADIENAEALVVTLTAKLAEIEAKAKS